MTDKPDGTQYRSRSERYHGIKPDALKEQPEKQQSDEEAAAPASPAPEKEDGASTGVRIIIDEMPEAEPAQHTTGPRKITQPQEVPPENTAANPESERAAQDAPPPGHAAEKKGNLSRGARIWIIVIAVVIAVSVSLNLFVFEFVVVDGNSMSPTLSSGEWVVAGKLSRRLAFPAKGEVVVTQFPNYAGYYVKRLIAYPGQLVSIKDGVVYLNGEPLDEPYLPEGIVYADMEEVQVPPGCVFVLGDNRVQSLDSRDASVGMIPHEYVIGTADCVIWPLENAREIE